MPYRISVTTLEKFRRCQKEETTFDTEAALVECLQGKFTGTSKTMFGGAFHKLLEGDYTHDPERNVYHADGCLFTHEQALPALRYREQHPNLTREMPLPRKLYETNYFPVQVSGRVDAVEGLFIRDTKCKFRAPDFAEYIDSCQWKFYLDMLDADVFYYDVFRVNMFPGDDTRNPYTAGILFPKIEVQEHETLECFRTTDMRAELQTILNDFMDYVHDRRLLGYLRLVSDDEPLFF